MPAARKASKPAGTVRVEFQDGTFLDTAVLPPDRMACEERYDICLSTCEVREKYTLFMLWHSLARQAIVPGVGFEAWAWTVQSIDGS